jgi:alginate O-acetyltransferase complex protein AlgI
MLFNSLAFLGFIAIVLLVYPRLRLRFQNVFLLIASYIFYGYWDWRFISLLFILTILNFLFAQKLHAADSQERKRTLLSGGIAVNLGILGFFKYFNFFVDSAATVLATIGFQPHMPLLRVLLPVGISFYTFQTMTYTIDIYRGKLQPAKNFVDFALFVSFFPLLLSGPIERATNILPQICSPRILTEEKVRMGLNLVLLGYFKKIAIADTLAPIADKIFAAPEMMSCGQLWSGVYAFTFQIYGDFSGYTDIARGIALILGFKVMENFNAPYFSRSITEFWRRWHISLSTWLRDYVYIPLGGSRLGIARTYVNLIITMFLCGLWHGAAWQFVIWGVAHGLYLAVHRLLLKGKKLDLAWPQTSHGWFVEIVKMFFTFHLVAVTWVFFKSPNISSASIYLEGLFRFQQFTGISTTVLFAASLVIALDVAQTLSRSHVWLTDRKELRFVRYVVAQLLFVSIFAAAIAHAGTTTPFIYFQF